MLKNFICVFDVSDNSNTGNVLAFSSTSDGTHGGGSEFVVETSPFRNAGNGRRNRFPPHKRQYARHQLRYYCVGTSGAGAAITVKPHNIDLLSEISQT